MLIPAGGWLMVRWRVARLFLDEAAVSGIRIGTEARMARWYRLAVRPHDMDTAQLFGTHADRTASRGRT
jgi:hypothetical protein